MKFKRIVAGIVVVTAVALFFYTLATAVLFSPASEISIPSSIQATRDIAPAEQPDRLVIPKIGVDAHIQHVGIAKSGNMAVPTNYTDVGWFREGTVPGQIGSAVIDGHVDNGFGLAAVFKRLSDLKVGDDIYIVTKTGSRLHFKVQELGNYAYSNVPSQKLLAASDAPRLNLITCEGAWISSKKMYDGRLVVYAVLVGSENSA